jgi:hypothetical protein
MLQSHPKLPFAGLSVRLSIEDPRAFAEAILNPQPPSSGLVDAANAYRKLIKASQ